MNLGHELPPKFESDKLSPEQEENLENLLSTMIFTKNGGESFKESIFKVKEEFLQILPKFIDSKKLEQIENISDKKELLKKYVEEISNTPVGWGFTPKLALEKEEGVNGFDCTGAAITLGAICEKHNIPIKIGKQIQHAVIIATIDGETYYADPRNSIFFNIKASSKDSQDHNFYKLSEDEQKLTASDYSLISTAPIDEFIGDAILENIEELKNLGSGNQNDIPSENISAGKIIAEKYRGVLMKGDWKDLHSVLYPHVNDFKRDHKLWQDEELRIKSNNEESKFEEILREIVSKTENGLGYSEEKAQDVYPQIISELKGKIFEVINFLGDDDLSSNFSGNSGSYINELKKHILPLNNKEKTYIIQNIEKRLTKDI